MSVMCTPVARVHMSYCHVRTYQEVDVCTPPKTNMEPENKPLEEEIPSKKPSFLGSMLVFGGVSQNMFEKNRRL